MALWLSEFLLEASGAFLAFRRRLWALSILLGFRAFVDLFTFSIRSFVSRDAYGYAIWASYAVQLVLLCWLAASLAGKLLREHKRLLRFGVFASVVGGLVVGFVFHRGEALTEKFLDAQISASCWLALVVLVAWFTGAGKLEKPWSLITAGLICSIAGNALCAMLWKVWAGAPSLYPVPAIAALLMWNLAGLRGWRLAEARVPLSAKKPPTSVWVPRKVQTRKF